MLMAAASPCRARFQGINTDLSGTPAWKAHDKDNGSSEYQVYVRNASRLLVVQVDRS